MYKDGPNNRSSGFGVRQARLASLRQLQSDTGEELDALLPSLLDKAFSRKL